MVGYTKSSHGLATAPRIRSSHLMRSYSMSGNGIAPFTIVRRLSIPAISNLRTVGNTPQNENRAGDDVSPARRESVNQP